MRVFLAVFLLSCLVFIFCLADTTKATGSYEPRLLSVYISSEANLGIDSFPDGAIDTLVPGGKNEIHVNGVVQDSDAYFNIDHVEAVLYRSGVPGANLCTANSNNCYRINSCDLEVYDYYRQSYDCEFKLWYYADATDFGSQYPSEEWRLAVEVHDIDDNVDSHTTIRKELVSLLSVNMNDIIDFEDKELGEITNEETNVEHTFYQHGNTQVNISISGGPMSCGSGQIPTENQAWSLEDVGYEDSVPFTEDLVDTEIELGYALHGQDQPTATMYFNLKVPENGVGGICEGPTVLLAK